MSQPRLTSASAPASSSSSPNSSTSAPAMKPLALPDAMTSPRGGSRSSWSSASLSSASTVGRQRVGRAPALSKVSRARPSASRVSVQCRMRDSVSLCVARRGFARATPVGQTRSTSIAPPSPPPMQIAAMPRRPPVRSSTFSTCSTIRAPDAPTGWPSAMAPPSTLSFASSSSPSAPGRPELAAAVVGVLPRALAGDHLRGERLVDLPRVEVVEAEAVPLQDRRRRVHRPEPHLRRIEARPCGVDDAARAASSLCFSTARSEASTSQAAPSVICELLPAVTLPYLRSKNGLSFARFSAVESSRTPSSARRACPCGRTAARPRRRSGPAFCAASTRAWLRAENSSISRRVMPKRNARFSAVWPISRPDHRIGEALHQADHRREVARA